MPFHQQKPTQRQKFYISRGIYIYILPVSIFRIPMNHRKMNDRYDFHSQLLCGWARFSDGLTCRSKKGRWRRWRCGWFECRNGFAPSKIYWPCLCPESLGIFVDTPAKMNMSPKKGPFQKGKGYVVSFQGCRCRSWDHVSIEMVVWASSCF